MQGFCACTNVKIFVKKARSFVCILQNFVFLASVTCLFLKFNRASGRCAIFGRSFVGGYVVGYFDVVSTR